jgi:hypothetical protein
MHDWKEGDRVYTRGRTDSTLATRYRFCDGVVVARRGRRAMVKLDLYPEVISVRLVDLEPSSEGDK